MSLIGNILKYGGAGLAAAAVPFTGGASGMLIPALMAGGGAVASGIGNTLSAASAGSAAQRGSENASANSRNSVLANLYGTNQNATMNSLMGQSREQSDHANIDLDRRKFALDAPSKRASQSVRGSILQNAQPFSVSGLPDRVASRIPQISGGLTPAMFSQETRQLGGELSRQALIDQLRGDTFDPLEKTDFKSGILPTPQLEEYQQAGGAEKAMGGVGLGMTLTAQIIDALSKARRPRPPVEDLPMGAG